jgi:glycosyltransferase involved in cell wall biosynthesis
MTYNKNIHTDYASSLITDLVNFTDNYIRLNKIQNLISTAPPFSFHNAAKLIKSQNPSLNLILDYRDPWINDSAYKLSKFYTSKNREDILYNENMNLIIADKITVATTQMKDELVSIYKLPEDKVNVLYNGYDLDDYKSYRIDSTVNLNFKKNDGSINVVYIGTIGHNTNGRLKALILIFNALEMLPEHLSSRYKFHLFSDLPLEYNASSFDFRFDKYFKCYEFVSPSQINNIVLNADMALSINAEGDGNAFGSKIFDYMAASIPILKISPPGELYNLLKVNKQYVCDYNLEAVIDALQDFSKKFEKNNGVFIIEKNLTDKFNYSNLTTQLIHLLKGDQNG